MGIVSTIIDKPRKIFKGIPTIKTLSCGTVFEIMPNATSVINMAATIGPLILNEIIKILPKTLITLSIICLSNKALPKGTKS